MTMTQRQKADRILKKVRSARYWHLTVLLVAQAGPLLAIALCLRIVQVMVGLPIELSPTALLAGSLAVVTWLVFRVFRRLGTEYEIAQLLDAAFHQQDSFATAWFLLANPGYATGPEVAAHIARATTRASEIELHKLFPLPTKSLVVVAALAGVLAVTTTTSRVPRHTSRVGTTSEPAPSPQRTWGQKNLSGMLSADRSTETSIGSNDKGKSMASSQVEPSNHAEQALSSQTNEQTTQPQDKVPLPAKAHGEESRDDANEVTSHARGGDRSSAANAPPKSASESADANAIRPHEGRTDNSSSSKASLVAQLFSPIRRLLDMAAQPSPAAEAAKQSATTTAPAPANNVASDRLQPSTHGPASNRPSLPPGYSSADSTAQQAAGSLPPSLGGEHPNAAPDLIDGFSAAENVIDLVEANPNAETGHIRVLAMQNARSGQQTYATDSDPHAGSARRIVQDDVPLTYERSIQAYLEHTREQPR